MRDTKSYIICVNRNENSDVIKADVRYLDNSKRYYGINYCKIMQQIDHQITEIKHHNQFTFQEELHFCGKAPETVEASEVRTFEEHFTNKMKEAYGNDISVKVTEETQ